MRVTRKIFTRVAANFFLIDFFKVYTSRTTLIALFFVEKQRVVPFIEDLILVTGPVFSLRELSKDLKATDLRFKILGKTSGFRSYFYLRSVKRILK